MSGIIRSPYPDLEIPWTTLPEFLFGTPDPADADRPAVLDAATGAGHTHGELRERVYRVATALRRRGVAPGDVVALCAPNGPDYPVAFHGVLAAGAVASPMNPMYTPEELAHQLRDGGARMLLCAAGGLPSARAAVRADGVRVSEIVVIGERSSAGGGPVPESGFEELVAEGLGTPPPPVAPDDVAALPYSSGTTGMAKGVMLTHRNLVANLLQMQPLGRVERASRLIAVLPLFHIYGLTGIMNQALHRRALVVTMPRFDLAGFLEAVQRYRIDHLYIAPPIALALAKHPLVDSYDLSSVRQIVCAAAPLDAELGRAVAKRLDATLVQGYGLTESSPCTHGIPPDRPELDRGSIGVPMPNVEVRVVDPTTGKDVEPGQPGELWCRGPNIMRGYLNNPEATARTVDADGFLHTGDLVRTDGDGAFHVVDRLKELIKYNGFQVAPAELEALLLTHPEVVDAAVVGVPDPECGELPKAFVVSRDEGLTEADVLAFVAARVAPQKKVRLVEFVERIPKSAAGKILRKELRARETVRS